MGENELKIVIWGNYKGGVGKTTSVFQVAAHFAKKGKKVLLIDLDPQCSLSHICCTTNNTPLSTYKADQVFNYAVELYMRYINSKQDIDYSLLLGDITSCTNGIIKNLCIPVKNLEYHKNLWFIPSSISFENSRLNHLSQRMEKNIFNIFLLYLFKQDINEMGFDYLFIDCPPSSNLLIQSAFLVSDFYIVPTIIDEISAMGVADYITEIEKTYLKYAMHEEIGGILLNKVFGDKSRLIGIIETLYKERKGYANNSNQIILLDKNISGIRGINSLISDNKYAHLRYDMAIYKFTTANIFRHYIGHRDNRSSGESIPKNTANGISTVSYYEISESILEILEDQK